MARLVIREMLVWSNERRRGTDQVYMPAEESIGRGFTNTEARFPPSGQRTITWREELTEKNVPRGVPNVNGPRLYDFFPGSFSSFAERYIMPLRRESAGPFANLSRCRGGRRNQQSSLR
jgi:hypothetical protein